MLRNCSLIAAVRCCIYRQKAIKIGSSGRQLINDFYPSAISTYCPTLRCCAMTISNLANDKDEGIGVGTVLCSMETVAAVYDSHISRALIINWRLIVLCNRSS